MAGNRGRRLGRLERQVGEAGENDGASCRRHGRTGYLLEALSASLTPCGLRVLGIFYLRRFSFVCFCNLRDEIDQRFESNYRFTTPPNGWTGPQENNSQTSTD